MFFNKPVARERASSRGPVPNVLRTSTRGLGATFNWNEREERAMWLVFSK